MKDVVPEREQEIQKEERWVQLIYDLVKYFKMKKPCDMSSLDVVTESVPAIDCESSTVQIPAWNSSITEFDEGKYHRKEY